MNTKDNQDAALLPLFRMSRDAVCGVRKGKVSFANPAACRLFGRDITGEDAASLFPGMSAENGSSVTARISVRGAEYPVAGVQNGELLLLTVYPDAPAPAPVTAGLIHRMRSGVFNLRLALDALSEQDADIPDRRLSPLLHSYYYLTHLIDELSDLRLLGRNELPVKRLPLDLGRLCTELMDSVDYFARSRKLTLRSVVPETVCAVVADRDKLEQILLILLSNSLLHTPSGGQITLTLRQKGSRLLLALDDSGEGISEADMPYVFTPRENGIPGDGAGLGLYIADKLLRLFGGTIVLESRQGKGTRVRISLPASHELPLYDSENEPKRPDLILRELSGVLRDADYDPRL